MDEGTTAKGETQRPTARKGGPGRRLAFGSAVLDERSLELWVGGKRVPLERRPLDALLYLLHHAGEVVTKDELAENLWPGRILTESTLAGCISKVRAALGPQGHTLIKTAHGFGYRFVGDVRVETVAAPVKPAFDFKPGDAPPLRPQWRLVERLGAGGQAEAWLARHEKTGDARVFKFALDAGGLTALKREITLYRLLHDTLGEAAAIVRIFEWNVEEPPYFLETEYLAARDLRSWAEAQGGLSQVPTALRLELVAQVAEALAAAHSVGVLHKDLKPGNILVEAGPNPKIKLADFGSGSVLDGSRLEALGITRMGFTKTLQPGETTGTPLYLAPETIAGQPHTVRADIFALGTILYQMLVGDFSKPLAPGWDTDYQDAVLSEDVALAAAGNPNRRLGDALQLAQRLRSVETRRQARLAAIAAAERAARARKIADELKRMRVYAVVLLTTAAAAVAGGVLAYRARNEAVKATATARAISDFLTEDVLRADSSVERPREASYESLLNRAGTHVDKRFKDDPEAMAKVHLLLGRRFHEIGQIQTAKLQYEKAARLFTTLHGRTAEPTLLTLDRLATIYTDGGQFSEALAVYDELQGSWRPRGQSTALALLMIRARRARVLTFAGDLVRAEEELRDVLAAIPAVSTASNEARVLFEQWFGVTPKTDADVTTALFGYASATLGGNVLGEFGENYAEGLPLARGALSAFSKTFGEESEHASSVRVGLGVILGLMGAHEEAEGELLKAQAFFRDWLPPGHFYHGLPLLGLAHLSMERGQANEARKLLERALALCPVETCSRNLAGAYRWHLGRACDQLNLRNRAIAEFRDALLAYENSRGPNHVATMRVRISLSDALRRAGHFAEAAAILADVTPRALSMIRPNHPAIADLRRLEGLLALQNNDVSRAQNALTESLQLLSGRLDAGHWQIKRARRELAQATERAH